MTDTGPAEDRSIAIIGMAGRFPGAADIDSFWANVRDGVESIRPLSDEELQSAGVSPAEYKAPNYVKACPVLDGIADFDAAFFGFSARDAAVMDPAHRIFLEVCWAAVEHAGYTGLPDEGTVGVFAGSGAPLYLMENLRSRPELMQSMGEFLVRHTGNDMNFLATRVSYQMDLRGPSINLQTACSTALVAVHLACQSLLRGDCTLALAGGSTVLVPHGRGYVFQEGEILAPDGHCRPFDADSAGTVFGSGSGCVVLKRLQDALDDGDTIHAVVRGSAINNDGAGKVGYLAPGVDGQAAVVGAALDAAGVGADSIGYIETHGTGTPVGDPIEVEALNQAFRPRTARRGYCAIGSVKSNIGHLGEAAAAASLIKAVMALKHRELPPSLGFQRPNPQIDFADSPFFVNDRRRPWAADGPRRCGITALGAGGTNCHLILEEAPPALPGDGARAWQLLPLSARTAEALDRAAERLAQALEAPGAPDLADAAYTLAMGRRGMSQRRVLVAASREEAVALLRSQDPSRLFGGKVDGAQPSVVFMFGGGGTQYARMGAELYAEEAAYREAFDECLETINPALGRDLRELVFCDAADTARATRELERPSLTLPALFATSYAMARLFESWGVQPRACIGHSMGEYVAACLAGVFTLPDALRLVMLRGRLFETVPPGAMLSVPLPEAELRALMPPALSIAAVNAPELCVASGPVAEINALAAMLAAREVESSRIRIDVAAHSSMLEPILDTFRQFCRGIRFRPPQLPFVSNLSGRFITEAEATDAEYWVRHLRSTVRFGDGVAAVLAAGPCALLEVGPGRTLSMMVRAQKQPARTVLNSMRHPQDATSDLPAAMTTLGRLWAADADVDWSAFYDGQLRNRVPLPTYPFEARRYWVDPVPAGTAAAAALAPASRRADVADWFRTLSWRQQPLPRATPSAAMRWLVFGGEGPWADTLCASLGPQVTRVATGARFEAAGPGRWRLDPAQAEQYAELFAGLEGAGPLPDQVLSLWAASPDADPAQDEDEAGLEQALAESFLWPTQLARALGALDAPVRLTLVTTGLVQIADEPLRPTRATLFGPLRVAPHEYPLLSTRCIDVLSTEGSAAAVVAELQSASTVRLVALRRQQRWVQGIEPLPAMPQAAGSPAWLRAGAMVLITGGLGGIGLEVAAHLARQAPVRLALLARQALPAEDEWPALTAEVGPDTVEAQRIRQVQRLRALGAEVRVFSGDVADAASLGAALDGIRRAFGPLHGVIHAAGVMDDGPMSMRSNEAMRRVLAPKVQGTRLLDALIPEPLDFFVLFSSVAAVLGLPGQVDYTAANAFMDAFAWERARRAPGRTLVINWNAWREVGMAEALQRRQDDRQLPAHRCTHPALDGYTDLGPTEREFVTDFSADRHWLLAEHRIRGSAALLPGTAFVELARAACSVGREGRALELEELNFVTAFQVEDGENRRLTIQVRTTSDRHDFVMSSGSDARAAPHVTGTARAFTGPRPPALDVAAVRARCGAGELRPADGFLPQAFVDFGPRWANIVRIGHGTGEALLELALDARFADDLPHFALHPALLDMATGAAQALIPGIDLQRDFYVPLGYRRVRVFGAMPARLLSHVQLLAGSGDGLVHFDVSITDAHGEAVCEISRFTMKRLDAGSQMTRRNAGRREHATRPNAVAELLRDAISPSEGLDAFDRAMAQPELVQVLASSVDVAAWQARLDAPAPAATAPTGDTANPATSLAAHTRPALSSEYAAPVTELEKTLVGLWQDGLGISPIGLHDDFFELGGHSLLLIQLVSRAKKQADIRLPLVELYAQPSVSAWVKLAASAASSPEPVEPKSGLKRVSRKAYRQSSGSS